MGKEAGELLIAASNDIPTMAASFKPSSLLRAFSACVQACGLSQMNSKLLVGGGSGLCSEKLKNPKGKDFFCASLKPE